MSIVTACILDGNPDPEAISRAVCAVLGRSVRPEVDDRDSLDVSVRFVDPQGGDLRVLAVRQAAKLPAVVPDGVAVAHVSTEGEARAAEIVAGLALCFGGWITLDVSTGIWQRAEKRLEVPEAEEIVKARRTEDPHLQDLDEALHRLLPPLAAESVRNLAADASALSSLIFALEDYFHATHAETTWSIVPT